jgi:two-component system cell cycle sensor histidine kinase/response regulator CckA
MTPTATPIAQAETWLAALAQGQVPGASPMERSSVRRYGVAVIAPLLAGAMVHALSPHIGGAVFPAFFAAIVLSATYGGTAPGAVAATLSAVIVLLFFPAADRSHVSAELWRLGMFGVAAALTLAMLRVTRAALRRAEAGEGEAQDLAYQLQEQATELEHQLEQSQELAQELELSTQELLESSEEARRGRDEAEAAERRYRTLVDGLVVGVVLMEKEAGIVACNPAAERILGLTADQMRGRASTDPRWRTIHEDGTPFPGDTHPVVLSMTRGESHSNVIMGVHRPDDSVVWIEINSRPLYRGGEANPYAAVASFADITPRKRTEEKLRQSEEQRLHSQKLEAVGELAGGVAHDFNNLLTAIKSYSEFLLEDLEPDDRRREDVVQIRLAAKRAADLTRRLLAFSRKQILEPQPLDLNEVVSEMEKMLGRIIGADIDVRIAPTLALGTVVADRSQIEQVVLNLAVNARDAMPDGGTLTIETSNVDLNEHYADAHATVEPGSYVVLTVSDAGCGMDRATQARIFEPFFTTKERGKGTGLGLSTVYGIVKQSGGHIWVYSDVGVGTTFRVYLPRVERVAAVERPAVPEHDTAGSETVLVAEDDDSVRAVVTRVLRQRGYTVLEAPNGREAIAICQTHQAPIHLILTDVIMPGMGGVDVARESAALRPEAKILLMSGYTDGELERRGLVQGRVVLLQKPFTPSALAQKVRDILSRSVLDG